MVGYIKKVFFFFNILIKSKQSNNEGKKYFNCRSIDIQIWTFLHSNFLKLPATIHSNMFIICHYKINNFLVYVMELVHGK